MKTHLKNALVYYFVEKQRLEQSICVLRMRDEQRPSLIGVGNDESLHKQIRTRVINTVSLAGAMNRSTPSSAQALRLIEPGS